jgi:hypothetical protein
MSTVTIPVYDFVRHESMRYEGNTVVVYPLVQPTILGDQIIPEVKANTEPAGHRCSIVAVPDKDFCWLPYGNVWHLLWVKP